MKFVSAALFRSGNPTDNRIVLVASTSATGRIRPTTSGTCPGNVRIGAASALTVMRRKNAPQIAARNWVNLPTMKRTLTTQLRHREPFFDHWFWLGHWSFCARLGTFLRSVSLVKVIHAADRRRFQILPPDNAVPLPRRFVAVSFNRIGC